MFGQLNILGLSFGGTPFSLNTDHKPLVSILSIGGGRSSTARIGRLCSRLQEYTFVVNYIPGKNNQPADCLSRLPCQDELGDSNQESVVVASILDVCTFGEKYINEERWNESMRNDQALKQVMEYVEHGWPEKRNVDYRCLSFWQVCDKLSLVNGILFRDEKCVPPEGVRGLLIEYGHEGHMGMSALKNLLRQFYWWPSMDTEIERFVRNCILCMEGDKNCRTHEQPLCSVPWPDQPWQKLGLDISGPFHLLPTDMKFAIAIIDYHSKWAEVSFTSQVTTESVLEVMRTVFSREGLPETIVTDNGVQFVSSEMVSYLKAHGIKHLRSALYDPQTNGQVERFNHFLKDTIKLVVETGSRPLTFVRERIWEYLITPHTTTGVSPFFLLKGRHPTSVVCPWWVKQTFPLGARRVKKW